MLNPVPITHKSEYVIIIPLFNKIAPVISLYRWKKQGNYIIYLYWIVIVRMVQIVFSPFVTKRPI